MLDKSRLVFVEMSNRYENRQDSSEEKQLSVSFALACKWKISNLVRTGPYLKNSLLTFINGVLLKYPDLEPETAIRLYEALGDKAKMEECRKKIAAKMS